MGPSDQRGSVKGSSAQIRGSDPVPLEVVVQRILDRFRSLYGHAQREPGADWLTRLEVEAAALARGVPLLENRTRWHEVEDYSARSGDEMFFGGKVGTLVYGPGSGRLMPILRAGEILHVGKNPTTGCGRIRVVSGLGVA
jgi:hypothetical protein